MYNKIVLINYNSHPNFDCIGSFKCLYYQLSDCSELPRKLPDHQVPDPQEITGKVPEPQVPDPQELPGKPPDPQERVPSSILIPSKTS